MRPKDHQPLPHPSTSSTCKKDAKQSAALDAAYANGYATGYATAAESAAQVADEMLRDVPGGELVGKAIRRNLPNFALAKVTP